MLVWVCNYVWESESCIIIQADVARIFISKWRLKLEYKHVYVNIFIQLRIINWW